MFLIRFYKTNKGSIPVLELLDSLIDSKSKESRIRFKKIDLYIKVLKRFGLNAGYPYIKKLNDDIWELRPLKYRILFFQHKNTFVLLHWFYKKTNKTPKAEIEKAIKEMKQYLLEENTNE